MALIAFGGGILDARGSIGGQVFSRNRFGAYIRARTTPINPNTYRQANRRELVGLYSQKWADDLTDAQRASWAVYAAGTTWTNKLGQTVQLTGFNHFMRTACCRALAGGSFLEDPPSTPGLANQDPTLEFTADPGTQNLSVTFNNGLGWAIAVAGYMMISVSRPRSVSRTFVGEPYRFADAIAGAVSPPSSPATVGSPWLMSSGQGIRIMARILTPLGKVSEKFYADAVVSS